MSWKRTLVELSEPTFIVLLGPTASGKSDLGFFLQKETGGVVVNADAIQCYQKVEIGAAKPPLKLRNQEGVYLFDWVAPPHTMSAREYAEKAWQVVDQNPSAGPFYFVGGSGFYLKALEYGMLSAPPSTHNLEEELKERGEQALFGELQKLDPERAQVISPKDHYRLLRSLEVVRATGKTFAQLQAEREAAPTGLRSRGQVLRFALDAPKEWLRDRVERRTKQMLTEGWIEEVESLLSEGLEDWWPMKSVGYREVAEYLRGELSSTQLPELIVQRTMDLAKKQRTWSRGLKDITMLDATLPVEVIARTLQESVAQKAR
jgi:tRNA dimethylallyltransferase